MSPTPASAPSPSPSPEHHHGGLVTAGIVGYLLGHRRPGTTGGLVSAAGTVGLAAAALVAAVVLPTVAAAVIVAVVAWPVLVAAAGLVGTWEARGQGLPRAVVEGAVGAAAVGVLGVVFGPAGAIVAAMAVVVVARHRRRRRLAAWP